MELDRIPPQSIDMERAVIGSMLIDRDACDVAITRLKAEDFYKGAHRLIFDAATKLFESTQTLDVALLKLALEKAGHLEEIGGGTYLADLAAGVATSAHIERYCQEVRDTSTKRRAIAEATDIVRRGFESGLSPDKLIGDWSTALSRLEESIAGGESNRIEDVLAGVWAKLDEHRPTTWPTGLAGFDSLFSGILPGELIVIAAKSKGGKSTLAFQWARHWAEQGTPILICSYEMSKEQIAGVLVASVARIPVRKDWSTTDGEELAKMMSASDRLKKLPVFVEACHGRGISQLEALVRMMKRKHGVGAAVVDYIQLVEPSGDEERRDLEVAKVSRRLKALAGNLSIPVIALSQLNDQGQTRESRAILHDCDMLIHIEAPEAEQCGPQCVASIIVKANRSGPAGHVQVTWQRGWRLFEDWTPPQADGGYPNGQ